MAPATITTVPKPQLEGIQTVPPRTITKPRQTRRVAAAEISKGCLNLVLFYYNREIREDSGWVAAGWMKESLSRALDEQSLLAGRLRKGGAAGEEGKETGEAGLEMEIVSNDSGARLVEATVAVGLKEFMEMAADVRAAAEEELVFWEEIDDQSPQFSPLLYVQVTNFKCGGYSVGISCTLLLADLLIAGDNFLQNWGQIQKQLISTSASPDLPLFYLPILKPNGSFMLEAFRSAPTRGQVHTLFLKITGPSNGMAHEAQLTELYAEELQRAFGSKQKFSSFRVVDLKESRATVSKVINTWSPDSEGFQGKKKLPRGGGGGETVVGNIATWEDLGIDKVSFYVGNKPAGVAGWVCWKNDDDVGLVMPISDGGGSLGGGDVIVVVAIPGGEKGMVDVGPGY